MASIAADAAETADADGEVDDVTDEAKALSRRDLGSSEEENKKFHMWNTVDQYDEKDVIEKSKSMRILNKITGKNHRKRRVSAVVVSKSMQFFPGVNLPDSPMDFTNNHVNELAESFANGEKLDIHFAQNILKLMHESLKKQPNVNKISVPKHGTLTVVGDTHGQISDVLYILKRQGMPSPTNMYLWNGDFVDRGFFGVEVFLLLSALHLANPESVWLNRGNHESEHYNIVYGFQKEVIDKYDAKTFGLFEATFNQLPLATIVNKKVFVVHGGLSQQRNLTVDDIQNVKRDRQIPDEALSAEDIIMQDLLWSDPGDEVGCKANPRGAGVIFGQDITETFLRQNKMKTIVRSHEAVDEGAKPAHGRSVWTLFSASNYCGDAGNYGAIMIFKHNKSKPSEIHQYMAPRLDVEKGKSLAEVEMAEQQEELRNISTKMGEYIIRSHEDLELNFMSVCDENGLITAEQWGEGMSNVLLLDLPYNLLQPIMAPFEEEGSGEEGSEGRIDFKKFLNKYTVKSTGIDILVNDILADIKQHIFKKSKDLKSAFNEFDANGDGNITSEEFSVALKNALPDAHLNESQISQIVRTLDKDGDGVLTFSEFVDGLSLRHEAGKHGNHDGDSGGDSSSTGDAASSEETPEWVQDFLVSVGEVMKSSERDVQSLFGGFDTDGDGIIDKTEFGAALEYMGCQLTDEHLDALMKYVDTDNSGTIDMKEFVAGFQIVGDETAQDWQGRLQDQLLRIFVNNKALFSHVFQGYDAELTGKVTKEDFCESLKAIFSLQSFYASQDALNKLAEITAGEDGNIDYNAFVEQFRTTCQ